MNDVILLLLILLLIYLLCGKVLRDTQENIDEIIEKYRSK